MIHAEHREEAKLIMRNLGKQCVSKNRAMIFLQSHLDGEISLRIPFFRFLLALAKSFCNADVVGVAQLQLSLQSRFGAGVPEAHHLLQSRMFCIGQYSHNWNCSTAPAQLNHTVEAAAPGDKVALPNVPFP